MPGSSAVRAALLRQELPGNVATAMRAHGFLDLCHLAWYDDDDEPTLSIGAHWINVDQVGWNGGADAKDLFHKGLVTHGFKFVRLPAGFSYCIRVGPAGELDRVVTDLKQLVREMNVARGALSGKKRKNGRSRVRIHRPLLWVPQQGPTM